MSNVVPITAHPKFRSRVQNQRVKQQQAAPKQQEAVAVDLVLRTAKICEHIQQMFVDLTREGAEQRSILKEVARCITALKHSVDRLSQVVEVK